MLLKTVKRRDSQYLSCIAATQLAFPHIPGDADGPRGIERVAAARGHLAIGRGRQPQVRARARGCAGRRTWICGENP
jgi:hypothetical protein